MQIFSVAQFITYVNETFKAIWDPTAVAIEGEVTGFRVSQGQWVNFDLKDQEALVSVFMVLRNLGVPLQDGMRVRVYGYPRVYPKYGKFSFSADRVEIVGEGGLRKALELLRHKLVTEGLFDPARKRAWPRFPRRIALVASKESAAYGDFLRILEERWRGLEVDVYHVLVQGKDAPESIVAALKAAGKIGYDVIVMTRGGGSLEELMAFNDEGVVRALYASPVPTLVGIGHERDVTLAEEVADVRGSTPTDCARRLVPDKRDVLQEVAVLEEASAFGLEAMTKHYLHGLERTFVSADRWLQTVKHRLETGETRAREVGRRWHERLQARLETMIRVIAAADPDMVLRRGYALVVGAGEQLVTRAQAVGDGDHLSIRFVDGKVEAEVCPRKKSNLTLPLVFKS